MHRRSFLRGSAAAGVALGFGPGFWRAAYAAPAQPGASPYGPLQDPDDNGVMLPAGFASRVIAVSGEPVDATGYVWHPAPDGAATFAKDGGGYYYAVNSEVPFVGGVGAIEFAEDGSIRAAYRILTGTSVNCAGGPTPWGTWLSCEEYDLTHDQGGLPNSAGRVWECDPSAPGQGVVHPAMGAFSHEAVAVDPVNQRLYLTEDQGDGRFYRFTPTSYPDLSAGLLEVAKVDEATGVVSWIEVPDPSAQSGSTRAQVPESTAFDGGEGIWYDAAGGGYCYFTTKGDNRVWVLDIAANTITVLYDANEFEDPPLAGVDNVVVSSSGDVFVAEDGDNLEINIIAADTRNVAPIMRLTGSEHAGSEITGPCFSPDGSRLYFSSQRGGRPGSGSPGPGITFEIIGPFRTERVGIAAVGGSGQPEPVGPPTWAPDPSAPAGDAGSDQAAPGSSLPATGGGIALGTGALIAGAALRRRMQRSEDDA